MREESKRGWVWSSLFTFMHWRRKWQPTPVFLPGESQGRGSLVGCCLWGRTELDMTERLHFHFSLSRTGEGNGNPLQRSCLENPRDGGAWWAAVYGVAQSQTRLKRFSSSSSSHGPTGAPAVIAHSDMIHPCYSQCSSWTSSATSPGSLLEMQNVGSQPSQRD